MKDRVASVLLALLVLTCAGCSWFARKPPAPVASRVLTPAVREAAPADTMRVESIAAARAACPGYDTLVRESPFPRDAILRGVDAGSASVVFLVDGTRVTVLSVTSSEPAFGAAATDAVRTLRCSVDRPVHFAIRFDWRTTG